MRFWINLLEMRRLEVFLQKHPESNLAIQWNIEYQAWAHLLPDLCFIRGQCFLTSTKNRFFYFSGVYFYEYMSLRHTDVIWKCHMTKPSIDQIIYVIFFYFLWLSEPLAKWDFFAWLRYFAKRPVFTKRRFLAKWRFLAIDDFEAKWHLFGQVTFFGNWRFLGQVTPFWASKAVLVKWPIVQTTLFWLSDAFCRVTLFKPRNGFCPNDAFLA